MAAEEVRDSSATRFLQRHGRERERAVRERQGWKKSEGRRQGRVMGLWPLAATLAGRSDGRGKDPGSKENSTRRGLDGVLLVALGRRRWWPRSE